MRTLSSLQKLTNNWVLLTGGAGYVAQAAAQALLEAGAYVILLDRIQSGLEQAKKDLINFSSDFESNIYLVSCDLSLESDIRRAMVEVGEISNGRLNVLINNAAFVGTDKLEGWCVPFEQQSLTTFKQCVDVNLSAPFLLCQLAKPLFDSHTDPVKSIINVSSIYGVVGPQMDLYEGTEMGNPAAYGTSKSGLIQLTKWLSSTLSPSIRANNLILGGLFRGQDERFLSRYNAKVPLQRMATEEDVKGAIAYLASELSNYMTGQSLYLDGGWTSV